MTTEEVEKAANDYANSIPQHEDRKRYCREDFLAGVEWMANYISNMALDKVFGKNKRWK